MGGRDWRVTISKEQLTEREQRAPTHLQRAQEPKVGLAEYARGAGVEVSELYSGKPWKSLRATISASPIPSRMRQSRFAMA